MDDLFEEMFESEDEAFLELLNNYATAKSEEAVKDMILQVENQMQDIKDTYPHVKTVARLVRRFHELFAMAKQEKKLIDFNDIEHFALEILKNEQAAGEYRDKFRLAEPEIFMEKYDLFKRADRQQDEKLDLNANFNQGVNT